LAKKKFAHERENAFDGSEDPGDDTVDQSEPLAQPDQ
jgi:hypothetical protein